MQHEWSTSAPIKLVVVYSSLDGDATHRMITKKSSASNIALHASSGSEQRDEKTIIVLKKKEKCPFHYLT